MTPKTLDSATSAQAALGERATIPGIIDCDVHPWPMVPQLLPYMSTRWATYAERFGTRGPFTGTAPMRPFSARTDAWPPNSIPGGDPEFARLQLLDRYPEIGLGILNSANALFPPQTGGNQPRDFSAALMKATNDWMQQEWIDPEPRWYGSISVPLEHGDLAADEIERCCAMSDHWVQVLLPTRMHWPLGNANYTPMIEAALAHDIPLGIHVGGDGLHTVTGAGWPSYFYELHCSFPLPMFNHIASLIFEGTFDRFPALKIVLLETNWSWAAPFAWRLDRCWSVLRDEVPHLQRKPSEYIADHLWFASQPAEEPEKPHWFKDAYEQFQAIGGKDRFMFATDYPHWDFDSPVEALPRTLPQEEIDKMLYHTASKLYGLTL